MSYEDAACAPVVICLFVYYFRLTIVWAIQVYDCKLTIAWTTYDFLADHGKIIYEILYE